MRAEHLEILAEEASMEAFLRAILPKLLDDATTFAVYTYQGKDDLMGKLPARLRGYASWLPQTARIIVLVDRDDEECAALKQRMEQAAVAAGLSTRSTAKSATWQVVNRIAIEELEAWYFGDWEAVRAVYPRVSEAVPRQERYRDPDAIAGGTWEAFERVLQRAGQFKGGLRKTEAARAIGGLLEPSRCCSRSFQVFRDAILEAVT